MDVRYCPMCGTGCIEAALFCHSCGAGFSVREDGGTGTAVADLGAPETRQETVVPGPEAVGPPPKSPISPFIAAIPVVEPAPIRTGRSSDSSRRRWLLPAAVGLALALIATSAFAFLRVQDLDAARSDLKSTNVNLSSTKADLSSTNATLASEQAAHQAASDQAAQFKNQASDLLGQLAGRDACIAGLRADEAELSRIADLQQTNFNRSAKGSVFAKDQADVIGQASIAANDYYKAYAAAYVGKYSTANTWVTQGNAAVTKENAAVKKYNADVAAIDAKTSEIDSAFAALQAQILQTTAKCQTAAGSS